jgi:surface protein
MLATTGTWNGQAGQFPPAFHKRLQAEAAKAGISLSTYVIPDHFIPLSRWDVSGLTSLSKLFHGHDDLWMDPVANDISQWDVSNVTDMSCLFHDPDGVFISGWGRRPHFNQPLANWNVSRVTNMSFMFHRLIHFNQPLATWDVSNVTDMSYMFWDARDFDQSLATD